MCRPARRRLTITANHRRDFQYSTPNQNHIVLTASVLADVTLPYGPREAHHAHEPVVPPTACETAEPSPRWHGLPFFRNPASATKIRHEHRRFPRKLQRGPQTGPISWYRKPEQRTPHRMNILQTRPASATHGHGLFPHRPPHRPPLEPSPALPVWPTAQHHHPHVPVAMSVPTGVHNRVIRDTRSIATTFSFGARWQSADLPVPTGWVIIRHDRLGRHSTLVTGRGVGSKLPRLHLSGPQAARYLPFHNSPLFLALVLTDDARLTCPIQTDRDQRTDLEQTPKSRESNSPVPADSRAHVPAKAPNR